MTGQPSSEQVDQLRLALSDFFHRLPEVPVYRRRDDPVIKLAAERVEEGRALLLTARQLGDHAGAQPLRAALEAHLEVLELLKAGRVEAAEGPWHKALALEREAVSARRLWSRTDEVPPPVYRPETGESRYDPRPEAAVKVKLACPSFNCRKLDDYDFSARHATHLFVCNHCHQRFYAYFAELLELKVETQGKHHHRYHFRVREMNGSTTRVEFDDGSEGTLSGARGDLFAFLYAPRTALRGVLDLSSSRVLWVRPVGVCFVATAVFGEDAVELEAFRRFRDAALLPSAPGRLLVRGYYRAGPALAGFLALHPHARGLTRRALSLMHRVLARTF